jgi:hypothetical protein
MADGFRSSCLGFHVPITGISKVFYFLHFTMWHSMGVVANLRSLYYAQYSVFNRSLTCFRGILTPGSSGPLHCVVARYTVKKLYDVQFTQICKLLIPTSAKPNP